MEPHEQVRKAVAEWEEPVGWCRQPGAAAAAGAQLLFPILTVAYVEAFAVDDLVSVGVRARGWGEAWGEGWVGVGVGVRVGVGVGVGLGLGLELGVGVGVGANQVGVNPVGANQVGVRVGVGVGVRVGVGAGVGLAVADLARVGGEV